MLGRDREGGRWVSEEDNDSHWLLRPKCRKVGGMLSLSSPLLRTSLPSPLIFFNHSRDFLKLMFCLFGLI